MVCEHLSNSLIVVDDARSVYVSRILTRMSSRINYLPAGLLDPGSTFSIAFLLLDDENKPHSINALSLQSDGSFIHCEAQSKKTAPTWNLEIYRILF